MAYSDLELRLMTDVAYLDLDDAYTSLKSDSGETSFSIAELINASDGLSLDKFSESEKKLLSEWKISKIHDDNHETGFYACVIETNQGAAVSFRGSEEMANLEHLEKDWLQADLGLLNSTLTTQQDECNEFLNDNKEFLNEYENLTMVGHSLGGNLADYATIVSEEYGLDDNITSCYNLDGPGFSNEFLTKNLLRINKMKNKMKHYSASPVGRMLHPVPGVDNIFVDANGEGFSRHTTSNWKIDENGTAFYEGKQDGLSVFLELLTQGIDKLPAPLGNMACDFICVLAYSYFYGQQNFFENGELTKEGAVFFAAFIAINVVTMGAPIAIVASMVAVILVVAIGGLVLEVGIELIKYAAKMICESLVAIWHWTGDMIDELYAEIVEGWKKLSQWYSLNFDEGYKYASANPTILVDTYKLRSYATRLNSVNRRVSSLDSRLNSLYHRVCDFEDLISTANALWNLLQADVLTSYSLRLKKCSSYLEETANDFEKAEKNIVNKAI